MSGHHRRIIVPVLASTCALFLLQSPVGATTIIPRTIAEAVSTAQVIFAGRVTQVRPERAGRYNTIVTRVTFDTVTEVKGAMRGRPTLLLRGGRIGNDQIGVDGQPEFSVGGEYVVLCTTDDLGSETNRFVPTLGMFEGVFRVDSNGTGPGNVVLDPVGRPVVGIESGRLIVLDATPTEGGSGQKMTLPIVSHDRTARVDPNEREKASSPRPIAPPGDSKRVQATPRSGPKPPKPSLRTSEPANQPTEHKIVPNIPKEPTVLVLDPTKDPGTRMTLEQFLEALRAMTR